MSTPPPPGREAAPDDLLGRPVLDAWMPTAVAETGPGRDVLRADAVEGHSRVLVHVLRVPPTVPSNALARALDSAERLRVPSVQRLLMQGLEDGRLMLVTPALGASSLATRFVTRPPTMREITRAMARVALALHAVHEQGRIYGPLTPEHVLLCSGPDGEDEAFIPPAWWAWRHGFDSTPARPWNLPCSDVWTSRDRRLDAWSLGALLWHGLTGAPPLDPEMAEAVAAGTPPPALPPLSTRVRRPVPSELEDLVGELLSADPDLRPNDMERVADRLEAIVHILEGGGPAIAPPMLMRTPVHIGSQLRERSLVLPVPPPPAIAPVPAPRADALMGAAPQGAWLAGQPPSSMYGEPVHHPPEADETPPTAPAARTDPPAATEDSEAQMPVPAAPESHATPDTLDIPTPRPTTRAAKARPRSMRAWLVPAALSGALLAVGILLLYYLFG